MRLSAEDFLMDAAACMAALSATLCKFAQLPAVVGTYQHVQTYFSVLSFFSLMEFACWKAGCLLEPKPSMSGAMYVQADQVQERQFSRAMIAQDAVFGADAPRW